MKMSEKMKQKQNGTTKQLMMIKRRRKIELSERREKIGAVRQASASFVGNHLAARVSQFRHYIPCVCTIIILYLSLPANYTEKLSVHCPRKRPSVQAGHFKCYGGSSSSTPLVTKCRDDFHAHCSCCCCCHLPVAFGARGRVRA